MTADAAEQTSGRPKMFSGENLKHIGALFGAFILTTAAVAASVEPTRAALSPPHAAQTAADRTVA
jgi:hypothetical protein